MRSEPRRHGFTLIEGSMVLVVVALVVGAIVVARSMIIASQVRATASQYTVFSRSLNAFKLKYDAMPGDLTQEQAVQFGMEPTSRPGGEGITHGNGLLEADSGEYYSDGVYTWSAGMALGYENVLFWRDLASAGLIEYKLDTATDAPAVSLSSKDIPLYLPDAKTKGGGYWTVVSVDGNNYFAIAGVNGTDSQGLVLPMRASLSANEAYGFDKAIDDGQPTTGLVLGSSPSTGDVNYVISSPGDTNCVTGSNPVRYNTSISSNSAYCNLVIGFRPGATPTAHTPPAPPTCSLPWGGTINDGQSVTAYQNSGICYNNPSETRTCNGGTLDGSYEYQTCNADCDLPWGGTLGNGQSVTAYDNTGPCASVNSETRQCVDGYLTGSYTIQSCNTSCTNPITSMPMNDGDSFTAYAAPTGDCSQTEQRTCSGGVVSGSYIYLNCTWGDCNLPWGGTLPDGQSVTAYSGDGPCANMSSESRTCSSGTLSGSYTYQSCTSTCDVPWGGLINSGDSVYAYMTGGPCAYESSETRYCNGGVLSGSFTYQNCRNDCDLPWGGTIADGNSVYGYSSSNPPCANDPGVWRTCSGGVLGGYGDYPSCRSDCDLPWGGTISDAGSVTAYSSSTYNCNDNQTRTCSGGVLSGSYTNQSCSQDCSLPWGGTLPDGQSVTAYAYSSGDCSVSESRMCSAGGLTGSYTNQSCDDSCTLPWGGTIANGGSVTAYQFPNMSCGTYETRNCSNGSLSGSYTYDSCYEAPADCSLPWGGTISDGTSVTAYAYSNYECGTYQESRSCSNGSLSGSYTNQSCDDSCTLPWGGSIANGGSVTAYQYSNMSCGNYETRVCSNTSLSGSYTYDSCSEPPPADCSLPWGGTIPDGGSVIAYAYTNYECGSYQETRYCTNGSLSGSYTNSSCDDSCALPWGGSIANGGSTTAYNYPDHDCWDQESRYCSNGSLGGSYSNSGCSE